MKCGDSGKESFVPSKRLFGTYLVLVWLVVSGAVASTRAASSQANEVKVLEKEGTVETAPAGTPTWVAAFTNQILRVADRVRTAERSRAALRLLDKTTMRMSELSEFLIEPLPAAPGKTGFSLRAGRLYFFHRDKPVDVQFKTPTATAAIRGTEFHLLVEANGRTVLTMFEGEVDLSNALGAVRLQTGEQGVVDPGQAPLKSPVINAINIIQWCLYYPGVLDQDDLSLTPAEVALLQPSLDAYRAGNLLQALAVYPPGRQPVSDAEKVYLGAVLLSVGQVEQADTLFTGVGPDTGALVNKPSPARLAAALRRVIAAVQNRPDANTAPARATEWSSTEWLAESYVQQSRAHLTEALQAARAATTQSPQFGFGWARVAELEFSFGRTARAQEGLDRSLRLAPRNAEAVSLRGFLLSAQNRIRAAQEEFERAIALDGALGNAWLGRGLCKIRRGELEAGREDLQVAATLEPQRALFRSYLGKAWQELAEEARAARELELAKERDPNDPTAWLYSALLLQQNNRINEAVEELERSQELNDHRQVYRSRLLLDQDRAVRGANLANIYRDAGMTDWSVREASGALDDDYANGSAHQFLADSFWALRDAQQINLRYETPALAEHLLANLLSPVGSTTLSPAVSQQEYSRLFERNGLGLFSETTYLSSEAWTEAASLHGFYDNTAFALGTFFNSDPGERRNQDVETLAYDLRVKQQISPKDELYLDASRSIQRSGDLRPQYEEDAILSEYRTKDLIEPTLVTGWHRQWHPGSHTLALAGYLRAEYEVKDPVEEVSILVFQTNNSGQVISLLPTLMTQNYRSRLDIWTAEAQHILQAERHTTVAGALYQNGGFDTESQVDLQGDPPPGSSFAELPMTESESVAFERWKIYGYHHWKPVDSLRLSAGLAYDWLQYPANHRSAPISGNTSRQSRWSPKAGVVWKPGTSTKLRAGVAWAVAGTSFDQSFQIEPTQIAGFNQSFRSLIPEAISGANAGAQFRLAGGSIEQRLGPTTFGALTWDQRVSTVDRHVGAYFIDQNTASTYSRGQPLQRLDYTENTLSLDARQLLGHAWVLGAGYRLSHVDYEERFAHREALPDVDLVINREALLQQLELRALFNHPTGFFAEAQAGWWAQDNRSDDGGLADTKFWQVNVFAGWRGWQRRAEVTLGILNLTAQDYQLNPLSGLAEQRRNRTLFVRLRLSF